MFIQLFFCFTVVFDVYRDSQVSTLMRFQSIFKNTNCKPRCTYMYFVCVCACVAGESVADRPEPFWRGDRLAAVQLGGANIWWGNCPAAGQPS